MIFKSEKKYTFLKMPKRFLLEVPIRDEIYSADRLEQYALYLSSELSISKSKERGLSLLPRFEQNYKYLLKTYKYLTDSIQKGFTVSPAGEWFIDNFHIIEDQVREVRVDLPEAYYRELPKLNKGELEGYPQVYVIALALVAHQDSHIDIYSVKKFLYQYQVNKPLLIGEVWAIAIALRLVLIENLGRLANQIIHFQAVQEWADDCADKILQAAIDSEEKVLEIRDELLIELEKFETSDCFIIVQLTKRLRDQSSKVLPISDCLEGHLIKQGLSFEQILHAEYKRQAESQVTVSNIVSSMRLLSNIDWQEFFEEINLIDPVLKQDPANTYSLMDFKSRDRYRHEIERLYKKTGISEIDIAKETISLSRAAFDSNLEDFRKSHVGYYLIDKGLSSLEKSLGSKVSVFKFVKTSILSYPTTFYFGLLFLLLSLFFVPVLYLSFLLHTSFYLTILLFVVSFVPIIDSCLSLLNFIVTSALKPRVLPKIDLDNVPIKTENAFVIIPTILADINAASKILDSLEIRFLANQEDFLYFALLSDFTDADVEITSVDDELLDFLIKGIDDLNKKYNKIDNKFFLFHRKRLWNPSESKWMGWERKRGKIQEFNQFLRGKTDTSFILAPAFNDFFSKINYVITLDSDTQLPRGSAAKLLGTILHPLNKPQFDYTLGRVVRGYAILQPRISITPESSKCSTFAKIFSGHTGIDPYTTAVSDVYQDLFGEGIYTGKGLYHVDCFEQALSGRVPENTLLSHDLFEGLFARVALISEIEFLDDYPTKYESFSKRLHRWSRGDWQILRWIFPYVPHENGRLVRNKLPFISRWKIFDNLRRSIVSITGLLWFILAWTVLPGSPLTWTLIILFVMALPHYIHVARSFIVNPINKQLKSHFWNVWSNFKSNSAQFILSIICLPHLSFVQLDAISRTLFRTFISKRNLLNWQTASDVEKTINSRSNGISLQLVIIPVVFSLGLLLFFYNFHSISLFVALPFFLGWFIFPLIIKNISRTRFKENIVFSDIDQRVFRNIARKTWNFFEQFVNEKENWLAPDNYQEDPKPLVAHRTSPTNMGLLMLSTCSAYHLGYINSLAMIHRLNLTLSTMLKLETCFGHFYNWYDTESLLPLNPKYISTVDSGNLVGHLVAVKQCSLAILDNRIFPLQLLSGFADSLHILEEKILALDHDKLDLLRSKDHPFLLKIKESLDLCRLDDSYTLIEFNQIALNLKNKISELSLTFVYLRNVHGNEFYQDISSWINRLQLMIDSFLEQIEHFTPVTTKVELDSISHFFQSEYPDHLSNWQRLIGSMTSNKTLKEHKNLFSALIQSLSDCININSANLILQKTISEFRRIHGNCSDLLEQCENTSKICNKLVHQMDFKVLFNFQRKLFSIGFNIDHGTLDNSFYDLLASESRLASFMAIAKGDIPQSHWFHLGRQMTSVYKERVLVSWSASMFEYLMPLLIMKSYPNTLLSETEDAVVKQQMTYAKIRGIPWGVSESAYNARDLQMNYQYGPFGVPGIGLKRGLGNDVVISPYSTALAALVSAKAALKNFQRLIAESFLTDYGFYEAIDYTKNRLQQGQKHAIIRNFMVHHQGMILTSLDNILNSNILQSSFHKDLMVRTSELLLQERTPKSVNISHPRSEEVHFIKTDIVDNHPNLRHINLVNTIQPLTQVLSNGSFSTIITAAGTGYAKSADILLSRWREDSVNDIYGNYIFISDKSINDTWSTTYAPMYLGSKHYKTIFSEHKAEFWCHKHEVASHVEVIVSSEDNIELRQLTLINHSVEIRTLDITSYMEPILTTKDADIAHRTFSDLFIETEYIGSKSALVAKRRRRSDKEIENWAIHLVVSSDESPYETEFETSRNKFIGRSKSISSALALTNNTALSNTVGAVLDPALSLRKKIDIPSHGTVRIMFVSGLTHSRDDALRLIDRYHDLHSFSREDEMGWTQSQAELRHLSISFEQARTFQQLGNSLLYPLGAMRSFHKNQEITFKSQSTLWSYGISGDKPILFVIIKNEQEISLIRQLLHAHEYFRYKQINYDLVILNAQSSSYRLELQDEILHQIRMTGQQSLLNKDGGIFVIKKENLPDEDLLLFRTIARVFINAENGNLKDQVDRLKLDVNIAKEFPKKTILAKLERNIIPLKIPKRFFENGYGGYSLDGREYIIYLETETSTPAPWCNVIANPNEFGFLVSETGSCYTWSKNSRENRISPWSNDPVCDPSGERFYIEDLESRDTWMPTPGVLKGPEPYIIRHGQGYSQFENNNYALEQKLSMFCSIDNDFKVNSLKLKNSCSEKRKISVTYYIELALGPDRSKSIPHIVTSKASDHNIFFAKNPFSEDFGHRVSFVAVSENVKSFTCDRKSFLGSHGIRNKPSALNYEQFDGKIGLGLDPCIAVQIIIELDPFEEREVSFLLGQSDSEEEIINTVHKVFSKNQISKEFSLVEEYWDKILNVIQVKTPYPEFDILINRWLLYQNLSCRIWARSAFYQSGGAFGFRDQLQDVMALLHCAPAIARSHILLAASHQFVEGDVLHWWHPPSDKGVRTHFSDDLLWLPYAVATYISAIQDHSILDEEVSFIDGPLVPVEKEDVYFQPTKSHMSGSLYEHCVKAIDKSLEVGAHGLPLMGSGDWNDGMNLVGNEGRGESVWMAWFLIKTINSFLKICELKNDSKRVEIYKKHIDKLRLALESSAWDGKWYKRAFFDDGSPLGSSENDECKIDSLTQSWAALSGVADPVHLKDAMSSLDENLVNTKDKLVLLFTPPFDKTNLNPGYIKGYLPGIRENGGQYTHAAVWAAMGFAAVDDGDKAFKLMTMMNPINHSRKLNDADIYAVEPYVISADIYSNPSSVGRGGWTWYTGSAGWYYRACTESILGLYREGNTLRIKPCLPKEIPTYQVDYKFGQSVYKIKVKTLEVGSKDSLGITLDGLKLTENSIPLSDDGKSHYVDMII